MADQTPLSEDIVASTSCKICLNATPCGMGATLCCEWGIRIACQSSSEKVTWTRMPIIGDKELTEGQDGGHWNRDAHEKLYGKNLNNGLADFVLNYIQPSDFLEFGSGLCALANYIGGHTALNSSYCLEPSVQVEDRFAPNLQLLNVDILKAPAPAVLNRYFDMVMSIEVIEHIPQDQHEAVFDFLVSRAGRFIVFSAARPGQGGHGHIAERPELEWRAEFVDRGCRFNPELTALARSMSNRRNINHRRNLQVFHAPYRSQRMLRLEEQMFPYLQDLLQIALRYPPGGYTGNLLYADLNAAIGLWPEHALHWKRENLAQLSETASRILEIGFAGGHSALLMLLANPQSKLTIVDPFSLPHSRESFEYLNSMFPGRLTLHEGYSTDILPKLKSGQFDLVHLDGGKEKTIARDLDFLRSLVTPDHVLCVDDTQNTLLNAEVERWKARGDLDVTGFEDMITASHQSRWTHCIARFGKSAYDHKASIIEMAKTIFHDVDHPSIYTNEKQAGDARADYLIAAVQDVDRHQLEGAFVEIGVAAGHSSVISALASSKHLSRSFFLYDTFQGFETDLPDEKDLQGQSILEYDLTKYTNGSCSAEAVHGRMQAAGCRRNNLFLVEGPAQSTLDSIRPVSIAILRLDADLYDPTFAALEHLYDLVVPGGYVIVDDYGHWKGCAEAVDTFFAARGEKVAWTEIDYTCIGWQK